MKAARAPAVQYLDVYPVLAGPTGPLAVCDVDALAGARYGGRHRCQPNSSGVRARARAALAVVAVAALSMVVIGATRGPAPTVGGGRPPTAGTPVVEAPGRTTLDPAERRAEICQDKSDLCPPAAPPRRRAKPHIPAGDSDAVRVAAITPWSR
jgi:hypothetical protein